MSVTVLVPLDGSPLAEHALPVAVAMARRTGAVVHLCRVCLCLPDPARPLPAAVGLRLGRRRASATAYLRTLAQRLSAEFGVRVRVGVRTGPPAESILREAELIGAELIVLTTHGHGESGPHWIGSVADEIAHCADCAVVLLPARHGPADWAAGAFRRILVPVDDPTILEPVLAGTADLRADSPVTYCLLPLPSSSVNESSVAGQSPGADPATPALHAAEVWIHGHGERTVPPRMNGYPPAPAVMYAAREFGADLIAFALSAKFGCGTEALTPLLERLVRLSPFPLLLHRPSVRRPLDLPALALPAADLESAAGAAP